ncbi:toxin-antitoxin system HicB family antitoxin [Metabacillus kandeliae]
MTKDDKKISYSLRMSCELHDKITAEATKLGISKSAYITMILHKTVKGA